MGEGQVRVVLCLERIVTHLAQQAGKTPFAIKARAHRNDAQEETDEVLCLHVPAVGHGHADTQVRPAAVAVEQRIEGTEEYHEHGAIVPLRQLGQGKSTGFTLAELRIALAIIGLLSAGAIHLFLHGLNQADAKAKVGELIGIAKECATFNAEADLTATPIQPPTGSSIACGGPVPTEHILTSREWGNKMTIDCLSKTIEMARKVTITVTKTGQLSCSNAN